MAYTRRIYIEMIRRQVYGGQPSEDAEITVALVNKWLNAGVAFAAKQNYTDNAKLEGIACVNNSFYITFKNLTVTKDENGIWKVTLPEFPVGVGMMEGVSALRFKSDIGEISQNIVFMTAAQRSFSQNMRVIPNKLLAWVEGDSVYVLSTIVLSQYTAMCTMISGGDSDDLDSTLNVPTDYIPLISKFLQEQFILSRNMPVDATPDGLDAVKTT